MNKEAFGKELEDCWVASGNHLLYSMGHTERSAPNRDTYITTRLAALDDGDGKVFEFLYNDCTEESSWATISIHTTKEGAIAAMEKHKEEKRKEWQDLVDWDKKDNAESNFAISCPFGQFKDWDVVETEILTP